MYTEPLSRVAIDPAGRLSGDLALVHQLNEIWVDRVQSVPALNRVDGL
jgi:hypothetical protein